MNPRRILALALFSIATLTAAVAETPQKKPPVGIPADATFFNGKWYRVYLEKMTWKRANEKCRRLGGQLVCVPDAATQAFIAKFGKGLELWLGATDEKVEGLWTWVDGSAMEFKAWGPRQPRGGRKENFIAMGSWEHRRWFDAPDDWPCVGFICEWKDR